MMRNDGQGSPRWHDPRRTEMKAPDDVSAMVRLKALGWGAKRIITAWAVPGRDPLVFRLAFSSLAARSCAVDWAAPMSRSRCSRAVASSPGP